MTVVSLLFLILRNLTKADTTTRPTAPPVARPGDGSGDSTHYTIYSLTGPDGRYFDIDFNNLPSINPNLIPHPRLNDTWYIVAQKNMTTLEAPYFVEIYCSAAFNASGVLRCIDTPYNLPISATFSDKCPENLAVLALNVGPHDARVFYGPESPMITYGSNSQFACFGQWVQDFRILVEWGIVKHAHTVFRSGTELQRPLPWHDVEKNFFLFWDKDGQMYVHNDVAPKRVFAKLSADGSVGDNMGARTAHSDDKCLAKYIPTPRGKLEAIHQATNSLSITLCNKTDPACWPTDDNTVLFAIIHHKSHYNDHSSYEPYVMMFRRRYPFELYAISSKPMWIHGRQVPSDMFFITSMSWKARSQKYHAYLDDVLFLAFGIEDRRTGGMDLLAGDLLQGLGAC
ncbi:hypothetical protein GQ53DRAFT_776477 [Thozetella sp. PMI_491]|nr:hypothetical protein GQ53DRAFT_776477 [Thozetella sp. PMI_491]